MLLCAHAFVLSCPHALMPSGLISSLSLYPTTSYHTPVGRRSPHGERHRMGGRERRTHKRVLAKVCIMHVDACSAHGSSYCVMNNRNASRLPAELRCSRSASWTIVISSPAQGLTAHGSGLMAQGPGLKDYGSRRRAAVRLQA